SCFFFQAEDGIRDFHVTGVQTCALPIYFDHTLYDGDSGSHLFAWLIRRSWWRTALALLAAPVFGPMVAFLPTRRYGISGFVWIGTVGMPGPPTLDDAIDRYVAGHEAQIRARLLPVALDVLHRHREAGD